MDLLLILTYTAICIGIFKIFKIPLNKWTVPTAVLGGIVLVGGLVFLMNYNHPHSLAGSRAFVTVPIIPNVKGVVVDVPVTPNTPIKKGDILFKIDPEPFEYVVAQKLAALNQAEEQVKQMAKLVELAKSRVESVQSERDRALSEFKRFEEVAKSGGVSAASLDNKRQDHLASEARLDGRQASLASAIIELKSHKNDLLQQRNSELASAEFELKSTVVRAPSDGYVTHVRVRPGMMATSLPFRPVMTFVPKQEHNVIAAFRQNAMQRLKTGYEAEVMFSAIPGKVFKAEVVQVQPALAEGEMQASGTLMTTRELKLSTTGLAPVLVRVKDDISGYILPDGVYAEVAIYSDQMHHVAIMRKILLRMKSWQSYIYLDH